MERLERRRWTGVVCAFVMGLCAAGQGRIIYVDDDALGVGDGSSWTEAYVRLQDALGEAGDSTEPVEVCIAQGIYKPDEGAEYVLGDVDATFQITRGLVLRGGFAGWGADDPNFRDVEACRTILTGDLADNDRRDLPAPLLASSEWRGSRVDNSLRVVTVQDVRDTVVLEGLTIAGGACSYCPYEYCRCGFLAVGEGGGIYSYQSVLVVRRCTFEFNSAVRVQAL